MTNTMQPRDRMIPWYFVMFFVGIAAVNAVMVTLALRTHTGLVTDHPYEKGLAYNAVIDAAVKQQSLGWSSTLRYADGRLLFALSDKHRRRIAPEHAVATITRPTQPGMDFTVNLTGESTPVRFPVSGQWEVRVDATHAGTHYQQSQRIVIP